jgi:hypothetical protein
LLGVTVSLNKGKSPLTLGREQLLVIRTLCGTKHGKCVLEIGKAVVIVKAASRELALQAAYEFARSILTGNESPHHPQ